MGIAIIAKGADFSNKNIGVITPSSNVPLVSIAIVGPATVKGTEADFSVTYDPANTSQRGVLWSITAGGTYATINENTGKLTVLPGASAASVTIKAESRYNDNVVATKTVAVTHHVEVVMDFNELKTYNQTSWQVSGANGIDPNNPIDGQAYYYIHADDNTKIGNNISTLRNVIGTDFGAYQVFKIPIPDGETSVELFPIKTTQYSGYAFVDNSDVVTGFIYNTTVNSGTAATYSIPAGSKFIYMPLSPSVFTNTNNGANLTVTFD